MGALRKRRGRRLVDSSRRKWPGTCPKRASKRAHTDDVMMMAHFRSVLAQGVGRDLGRRSIGKKGRCLGGDSQEEKAVLQSRRSMTC
jgi:hypothetical protein